MHEFTANIFKSTMFRDNLILNTKKIDTLLLSVSSLLRALHTYKTATDEGADRAISEKQRVTTDHNKESIVVI